MKDFTVSELEADTLRNGYAVRPINQLGTCGWYPRAWQVEFVTKSQLDKRYPGIKVRR